MSKFRKKPLVIEAFQMKYEPFANLGWPSWFREAAFKEPGEQGSVYLHANGLWVIYTLEGLLEINPDDYVIQGIMGEIYPCKPDIFAATYERAEARSEAITHGAAWDVVAASAYRAYAASTGNKNYQGNPMPAFDALPEPIRVAWQAAVRQAGSVFEGGSYGLDVEQRWSGWKPKAVMD